MRQEMETSALEEGAGILIFLECADKTALLDGLAVVPGLWPARRVRRTPNSPIRSIPT